MYQRGDARTVLRENVGFGRQRSEALRWRGTCTTLGMGKRDFPTLDLSQLHLVSGGSVSIDGRVVSSPADALIGSSGFWSGFRESNNIEDRRGEPAPPPGGPPLAWSAGDEDVHAAPPFDADIDGTLEAMHDARESADHGFHGTTPQQGDDGDTTAPADAAADDHGSDTFGEHEAADTHDGADACSDGHESYSGDGCSDGHESYGGDGCSDGHDGGAGAGCGDGHDGGGEGYGGGGSEGGSF